MKTTNIHRKQKKTVVITTMPISVPVEEAFKCAFHDRKLIDSICRYASDLRGKGVEVFERKYNIIATEQGYFCAFYNEDLETMEKDPVSFKGEDGRMKVQLWKDGKMTIEDVALLVAQTFVPNPFGYTEVGFRDGNLSNPAADNLYWIPSQQKDTEQ